MKQIRTPEEGERLLYAAVIYTAKQDATGEEKGDSAALREVHRRSALIYFRGSVYQHHCETLGIEPILPPEVKRELGNEVEESFQTEVLQEEILMTRSMDEIFTQTMCLSLHKRYLVEDLAMTDLFVEKRKGKPVSSATISKYFNRFGLPTRPQGGWTPEAHAAALAVHGLAPQDVEAKVAKYTRSCAVCGKEINRYVPFSGSPEYTHCGGAGCSAEVRSRRRLVQQLGEEDLAKPAPYPDVLTDETVNKPVSITKRNGAVMVGSVMQAAKSETAVSPVPEPDNTQLEETAVSHTNGTAGLAKIDSLRDLVTELEAHGARVQVSGKLTVELEF
jgi:hypothetical protein